MKDELFSDEQSIYDLVVNAVEKHRVEELHTHTSTPLRFYVYEDGTVTSTPVAFANPTASIELFKVDVLRTVKTLCALSLKR